MAKQQNGRSDLPAVSLESKNSGAPYLPLLTTFFSSLPGVNLATLRAAILIVAPVCGFRPLRALRCETENVPNPIKATRSPLRRAAVTLSTVVSIAVVACAFDMLQAPAIRSTRSALFMLSPDTCHYGSRAFSWGRGAQCASTSDGHFPLCEKIVNGKHVPVAAFSTACTAELLQRSEKYSEIASSLRNRDALSPQLPRSSSPHTCRPLHRMCTDTARF